MLATAVLVLLLASQAPQPGVPPDTPWTCPASHPIKGYLTESGRRIYFPPDSTWYDEASPDRCYASEAEALSDGGRPTRPRPRRPLHEWI